MILNFGNNTGHPKEEQGSKSSDWGGKRGRGRVFEWQSRWGLVWNDVKGMTQGPHPVIKIPGQQMIVSAEIYNQRTPLILRCPRALLSF